MLFVVLNVLPNPHAYFRTAALARLSAADSAKELNLTAPMDASRLAQTFLSPTTILRKEVVRYRNVVADLSWWEALLWLAALPAFVLFRRAPPAIDARLLLAGAALGAGIVFNSSSPLYAAAIFPFFVPVAASFVTHGFGAGTRISWSDISGKSVAVILALAIAILPGLLSHGRAALTRLRHRVPRTPRRRLSRLCKGWHRRAVFWRGRPSSTRSISWPTRCSSEPGQLKFESAAPTTVCRTGSWSIGASSVQTLSLGRPRRDSTPTSRQPDTCRLRIACGEHRTICRRAAFSIRIDGAAVGVRASALERGDAMRLEAGTHFFFRRDLLAFWREGRVAHTIGISSGS